MVMGFGDNGRDLWSMRVSLLYVFVTKQSRVSLARKLLDASFVLLLSFDVCLHVSHQRSAGRRPSIWQVVKFKAVFESACSLRLHSVLSFVYICVYISTIIC
jgi:hypothetical protein